MTADVNRRIVLAARLPLQVGRMQDRVAHGLIVAQRRVPGGRPGTRLAQVWREGDAVGEADVPFTAGGEEVPVVA